MTGVDIPNPTYATGDYKAAKAFAEAAAFNAQARHFQVQTDGQRIDNRTAEALARSAEIALSREELKELWEGASDGRNRVYHFTDQVGDGSVEQAVTVLNKWRRIDNRDGNARPYRFIICSAGGSVVHGMKLFSTLKAVARERELITVASGICASMATILHQAGTLRLIEPGCSYMIHDVSGEAAGSISSMQDTMEWFRKLNGNLHAVLAERSNIPVEEIAALGARRDSWFMPDEVVKMGLADEIGYAPE